ncbi:sugar phosphate isomerase/epimerase family protein [Rubritalea tangerina]|uniref:Sugar phosphate isomerase/epimerase family protein n=1 Tax=Rubritalea tangerina TaxID=430798 RepID=A0ABW4Z9H9_9BACT
MSDIKFGAEVYTWFMDGYGDGNANKLDHMAKVVKKGGFKGIEPMVLEPYDTYWLGDFKDPAKLKDALDEAGVELAALALICAWDQEEETESERACADWTIETLKLFPGAALGTVPLPGGRHNLQQRRLNLVNNVNHVSRRAAEAGLNCSFHPNSPPGSLVRTQEDYDVVLNSLDPSVTGWTPDVGHIVRGGMDIIDTMTKWQHLINHVHYKDFSGNGPEPWSQMGSGKVDFHKITEFLVQRNYKGWIICEDECEYAIKHPDEVTIQNGEWCNEQLVPLLG